MFVTRMNDLSSLSGLSRELCWRRILGYGSIDKKEKNMGCRGGAGSLGTLPIAGLEVHVVLMLMLVLVLVLMVFNVGTYIPGPLPTYCCTYIQYVPSETGLAICPQLTYIVRGRATSNYLLTMYLHMYVGMYTRYICKYVCTSRIPFQIPNLRRCLRQGT
ncbi:hypothetical protein F4775DRAFT_16402 [Biscogniauxia sp. FL1348]|nr:hypothetical protein F4775DRAFT_16402 [Biscogniauxia sp. FL1348]